jgi:predicted dehydrogenase
MHVAFVGSSYVRTPDYLAVCRGLRWADFVGAAHPEPATRGRLADLPPAVATQADLPPHDLAVVLTDIASHDEICMQIAAPAVFHENPLAVDGVRAGSLAQALSAAGRRAEVGFFLRHTHALAVTAGAVRDPAMGAVRFARFAFAHPGLRDGWLQAWPEHKARKRMGGGTFADLGVHLVDAARHLLGPVGAVSCDLEAQGCSATTNLTGTDNRVGRRRQPEGGRSPTGG